MVNNNGSRRSSALTRGEIAAAALRMFATDGLSGLSMRRLGNELGVHYSTLYWHISDKQELLRLVLDAVLADVTAPAVGVPWQTGLADLFRGLRDTLRRHPGSAVVLLDLGVSGPNANSFARNARDLLRAAGLDEPAVSWAYHSLVQFTAASVQEETASPWQRRVDRLAERAGARGADLEAVAPERGAGVGGAGGEPEGDTAVDRDAQFGYGLDCLLKGIAAPR
jgi:TetR/AcrR family transcriptional regulator, tetracycline repressor protein